MEIRFGTGAASRDFGELVKICQVAEECGYDFLTMPDTQSVNPEMYVNLTLAALNTQRVRLGPAVTNPITRHPAVTASAIAAIDTLSNGRAYLGIATGDSAVHNLGEHPARLSDLREYILAVRGLLHDGQALYRGKTIKLEWTRRTIPIYMAAEGPKALEMAGEICDGVIIGTGLTPEVIEDSVAHVRAGATRAGRNPDDVDVWWQVKCNVAEDGEAAVFDMRMSLAASASHCFRMSLEKKGIPPQYVEPVRQLLGRYNYAEHELPGADRHNARLVDELGLRDYLADRFAVAGTPAQAIAKLEGLIKCGATQFKLATHGSDRRAIIRYFADNVMAHFR